MKQLARRIRKIIAAPAILTLALQCSATDEMIKPIQAEAIKPFQAEAIKPIQSETIKPVQSDNLRPLKSPNTTPSKSGVIQTEAGSGTIEPFRAEAMKPMKPAGIDVAPDQGPLDRRLVGTWDLFIPGVAYQNEIDRGSYTARTLHVGAGTGFGMLIIRESGEYHWTKNGYTSRGKLKRVIPHNFAAPKQTYWRIQHEKETFYIATETPGKITLYSPASNLFAAGGKRRKE